MAAIVRRPSTPIAPISRTPRSSHGARRAARAASPEAPASPALRPSRRPTSRCFPFPWISPATGPPTRGRTYQPRRAHAGSPPPKGPRDVVAPHRDRCVLPPAASCVPAAHAACDRGWPDAHIGRRARRGTMSGVASVLPTPDEYAELVPGRDSPVWRYGSDIRLFGTAGYALLLQVAHPTVGAGVAEHSTFQQDPWGRLHRTLDYVHGTIYGGPRLAGEIGRRVREMHRDIKGVAARRRALPRDGAGGVRVGARDAGQRDRPRPPALRPPVTPRRRSRSSGATGSRSGG